MAPEIVVGEIVRVPRPLYFVLHCLVGVSSTSFLTPPPIRGRRALIVEGQGSRGYQKEATTLGEGVRASFYHIPLSRKRGKDLLCDGDDLLSGHTSKKGGRNQVGQGRLSFRSRICQGQRFSIV